MAQRISAALLPVVTLGIGETAPKFREQITADFAYAYLSIVENRALERGPTQAGLRSMKQILVEGWRGICHSFAMVNQFHLIELAGRSGISLRHRDLPYFSSAWSSANLGPGFPRDMAQLLEAIPGAVGEDFDSVLRMSYPFGHSTIAAKKVLTFMVTEMGLSPRDFSPDGTQPLGYCGGEDIIITPSNWSRNKLIYYGFPEEKVHVVSHGVSSEIFYPLNEHEWRAFRRALGLGDEDFVFLNVGSLTSNKGVPYLVDAFARLRSHYANARLILKDSSGLFGITVASFLDDYVRQYGPLPSEVMDSIYEAPSNLSLPEMRLLYGGADSYVSPYRAEGFNLPVIEAIACGTPAIVTAGGPTDDFCDDDVSLRIAADLMANSDCGSTVPGWHLEPRFGSLLENMERALTGSAFTYEAFEVGRRKLVGKYSWASATDKLLSLM